MFPQFKKINNESGVVLFIVLMTAIIIMIFSVGILTQSLNETNYAQQQVDQIVSDELAKGMWWNMYANAVSGSLSNVTMTMTMPQGRSYQMSLNSITNGTITNYSIVSNYDTFQ